MSERALQLYAVSLQHAPVAVAQLALAAILALGAAFLFFSRRRRRPALLLLFVAALLVRLHVASDLCLHPWDERYHALVAKHLAAHPFEPTLYESAELAPSATGWLGCHVWLHKPPLALWLMAGSIATFGPLEIAVRLPSVLASALGVLVLYRLGARLVSPRAAFLAAFFLATSEPLLDLVAGRAASDHVDTLLVTLVLAGVEAATRPGPARAWPRLALVGAWTGLALLTKSLPALLVPLVGLVWSLAGHRPRREAVRGLLVVLAVAALVAAPWELFARARYPVEASFEGRYALRHLTEVLEGHDGDLGYYLALLVRRLPLGIPALAWFLAATGRDRSPARVALAAWILVPFAVFTLAATKMPSYVLVAWPALLLVSADFFWRVADSLRARRSRARTVATLALLAACLVAPLAPSVRYLGKHVFSRDRDPAWARELRGLEARLPPGRATVLVNADHAIEAMFYAPVTAYPWVPDAAALASLEARGYGVVAFDDGRLPARDLEDPYVLKLAPRTAPATPATPIAPATPR